MNPLRPVMAALLAASCATTAAFASAGKAAAPSTSPAQAPTERDAVSIIARLIDNKDSAARAEVGNRFAAFLKSPDAKGVSFLSPDLAKDEKILSGVLGAAKQWALIKPASAVAELYFVMGPETGQERPSWVQSDPLLSKSFTPGMRFSQRLLAAMERFRGKVSGLSSSTDGRAGVAAFMDAASGEAAKILFDKRAAAEFRTSILQNKTEGAQPPSVNGPASPVPPGAGPIYTAEDLYGSMANPKGAFVVGVHGPKEPYRLLSVKMYTAPDGKGGFENMVGVVDITPGDARTPYGFRTFPLNQAGSTEFSMRDGGRDYLISASVKDGKQGIVIQRTKCPGCSQQKATDEGVVNVTFEELAERRAAQIVSGGSIDIGGSRYYTLCQGGAHGTILFFEKEAVDGRSRSADPVRMAPAAKAAVSEPGENGSVIVHNEPPGPDIGDIRGKPYHLELGADSLWHVKPGRGYVPPPPKPPVVVKTPESGSGGDGNAGSQGDCGTSDGVKTLADVVADCKSKGFQEPPAEANEDLSVAMKQMMHILSKPEKKGTRYCFFFAPGVNDRNQFCPEPRTAKESVVGLRGFDKYGVIEFKDSSQYLSLEVFRGKSTKVSGQYSNGTMSEVSDVGIAVDILQHYEGLSDEDARTLTRRLEEHAWGDFWIANVKEDHTVRIYDGKLDKTCLVWPEEGRCLSGSISAAAANFSGQGTAVDPPVGPDAEFPRSYPLSETQTLTRVNATEDGGTALYEENKGAEKNWYLWVKATLDGTVRRFGPYKFFGTGKDLDPLPARYELRSYTKAAVTRSSKLNLIVGEGGKKGAVIFFRTVTTARDASNVKDKAANCIGPVLYWGVDFEGARKACLNGKF